MLFDRGAESPSALLLDERVDVDVGPHDEALAVAAFDEFEVGLLRVLQLVELFTPGAGRAASATIRRAGVKMCDVTQRLSE